jgi:hypothetical protein
VVARHGSETRFGDDQQEMSFLVEHIAELRTFYRVCPGEHPGGREDPDDGEAGDADRDGHLAPVVRIDDLSLLNENVTAPEIDDSLRSLSGSPMANLMPGPLLAQERAAGGILRTEQRVSPFPTV